MRSKSRFWPPSAGFILAILVQAPAAAAQYLTVTSSPDPNRVEPGLTTLQVQATTPKLNPIDWPFGTLANPPTFKLWAWFRKPGSTPEWQAAGWYAFTSPEKTVEPHTSITFEYDFPVPPDTKPGKQNARVALMGAGNTCCLTFDGVFLDVVAPRLHPGSGPVTLREKPRVSPPPVQKPPEEQPRPYRPGAVSGGARSGPPSSERPLPAQSAPPRVMRPGERLTLQDDRILVMRRSTLVLLDEKGSVLRSYPSGSIAFVSATGDVSIRTKETAELLGIVRR
jgi:hypothetical protein